MATLFKNWTRGKPLPNLLPNQSTLTYWWKGKPVSSFGGGGGTIVPCSLLHLTFTPHPVTVFSNYHLQITETLSLTLGLNAPHCGAGATEEIQIEALGATVITLPIDEGIRLEAIGITLVFKPGTSVACQAPLLSLTFALHDPFIQLSSHLIPPTLSLVATARSISAFSGTAYVESARLMVAYDTTLPAAVSRIATLVGYVPDTPTVDVSRIATIVAYSPFAPAGITAAAPLLSLTITAIPTQIGGTVTIVDILHLTSEQLAPSVNFGCKALVAIQHLTFTTHSASVIFSITATPSILHLTFATHDPHVGYVQISIDAPLHLTVETLAPTYSTGIKVSVAELHLAFTLHPIVCIVVSISAALHLISATHAPIVPQPVKAYPSIQDLTLTLHDPTVLTGTLIGASLHLTSETLAPTIKYGYKVVVGIQHLTSATLVPTIKCGLKVTVSTLHLTATAHDPSIITGVYLGIPQQLTLGILAPTLFFDYAVLISSALHLVSATHAPTIKCGLKTTVSTLHLTSETLFPTIIIGARIYETLHLVSEVLAPTINYGYKVVVGIQHLTAATHVPIVPQPIIVAISAPLHLTAVAHDPQAITGAHINAPIHIISETLAPTIKYGYKVVVGIQHLTFATHAPTVKCGLKTTISAVQHLTLASYVPQVLSGVWIGETIHGVLGTHIPTLFFDYAVLIDAPIHLRVGMPVPTIKCGLKVTVNIVHLNAETSTPVVTTGARLYETLDLTLSQSTPTVNYGATASVGILHLTFKVYAPTIRQNVTVFPIPIYLTSTVYDPDVFTGVRIYETLHITFEQYVPSVTGVAIITTITCRHLTLTPWAVTVRVSQRIPVSTQSLTFTEYSANAATGARIYQTLHLVSEVLAPVPITYVSIPQDTLHLSILPHDPMVRPIITLGTTGDILHKERDWAAEFSNDKAQYASRPGTSLSPNFPFSVTGGKKMTACFWIRFKSFPQAGFDAQFRAIITKDHSFKIGLTYSWLSISMYRYTLYGTLEYWDTLTPLAENGGFTRFTTNRWYHVGISIDGQTGKVYVQVWDDFLKQQVAAMDGHEDVMYPSPPYQSGSGNFYVGSDSGAAGSFLDGYLDELVLFNDIRSPMEIDAIRKGTYNGRISGEAVASSALMMGYGGPYDVQVETGGLMMGYNEGPLRKVDTCGLSVGYILAPVHKIPPPPVIGGLAGGGAGEGSIDFCHLSYKFKTEVYSFDYGSSQEGRFDNFSLPTQHLEASLGSADQGAYFHFMSVLRSGAEIFSAPVWALRSTIVDHARAGQTVIVVDDASNYNVNETLILMRANNTEIFDLATITSIAGNTIFITPALENHYHPFKMPTLTQSYDERCSYVAPCLTGIVDIEDHGLRGPRPSFFVKVKVDGGAWAGAQIDDGVPVFTEVPLSAAYVAPRIERVIAGQEDGILELMPHFPSARLAFELEWSFIDNKWKLLRELFFAAKGRSKTFHLPTWVFELTAQQDAIQGATEIYLDPAYSTLIERFPFLYFMSGRNADRFVVSITGVEDGTNLYHCEPLEHPIYKGDRACFYPQVRFLEDELIFEFLDIGKCAAKVSFIEVLA